MVGFGPNKAFAEVRLRKILLRQKKRFTAKQALEHPFFDGV